MVLLVRTLIKGLGLPFRPRLEPLAPSVLHFRVWPNDLDVNVHMNNGRFLTVMDLGRFDLSFRTSLGRVMLRSRWQALVGGVTIRYRRSLAPFERYALHTRLLGWDDKWFFLEQRFLTRDGSLSAEAVVRALFRGGEGNIPVAEVLQAAGFDSEAPVLPDWVRRWADG